MTERNDHKAAERRADQAAEQLANEAIETSIRTAVTSSTPDLWKAIAADLRLEQPAEPSAGEEAPAFTPAAAPAKASRRTRSWYRALAGVAAALLVFVGVYSAFRREPEAFAVVGLDVNPSIEFTIDENERVLSAEALNADGEAVLADLDLKGVDANTACSAVVGSMVTHGYLTDVQNSVLVSVRAKDPEKGRALEEEIAASLNTYFEDSQVAAAIFGQYVEDNEALAAFAAEHNISLGKAWLIRQLLASGDGRLTEASLLQLSTQELILLGQEKHVADDVSYGKADTSKYIAREDAIAAALRQAGLSSGEVTGLKAEFDCENGVIVYEVEFTANGREYEYDVDASTGRIVSSEVDRKDVDDDDNRDEIDDDDDQDDDRDEIDDDDDRYDDRDDDDNRDDDHDDDRDDDDHDDDDRDDDDDDDD